MQRTIRSLAGAFIVVGLLGATALSVQAQSDTGQNMQMPAPSNTDGMQGMMPMEGMQGMMPMMDMMKKMSGMMENCNKMMQAKNEPASPAPTTPDQPKG